MPKSGQAFEVPDAQNSGIVNLVLYYQTSFPGLLNVSGKLPTYPYIYIYTRPVIFAPLKEAGFQRIMCNPQWTVLPLVLPLMS